MDTNRIVGALSEVASDAWGELTDSLDLSPKRSVQYLILFPVTTLIYGSYLKGFIEYAQSSNQVSDDKSFYWAAVKLICSVGWPFLLLSLLDREWAIIDTKRITVAAYIISLLFWLHRYNLNACALGSLMLFVPLFFSAIAFHGLGALRLKLDKD